MKLLKLFKKLPPKDIYIGCTRCNYTGCYDASKKYGFALGHWVWTFRFIKMELKSFFKGLYKRLTTLQLDYSQIEDCEIDGMGGISDHDFCDCYIVSATYKGREMTEEELDVLNDDSQFVYEEAERQLY